MFSFLKWASISISFFYFSLFVNFHYIKCSVSTTIDISLKLANNTLFLLSLTSFIFNDNYLPKYLTVIPRNIEFVKLAYTHDITYVKQQLRLLRAYLTVHLCCIKQRGVTGCCCNSQQPPVLQTCWLCFCGYRVRRRANCSLVNSERRRLERVIKKEPTLVGGQIIPMRVGRQ